MKYLKKRRWVNRHDESLEDPLASVANLFDASVVFIISMMIALFMAYNMLDLLDSKSKVTIMKKTSDGKLEIITKNGEEIKVQKVTDKRLSGVGVKLGTAYQLSDGKVVYVPE